MTPTEPVLTRRDDGHITVEWPEVLQREWPVSHELLVLMIDEHNRLVAELDVVKAVLRTIRVHLTDHP